NIPNFTLRDLMNAGVHYGHKTLRWNPKMSPFIYGERNNVHIMDLRKTYPMLKHALDVIYDVVLNNGRILFVGTKLQASESIAEAAKKCGQYYVNHRWLGGMLTNWSTVSKSIKTLIDLEQQVEAQNQFEMASSAEANAAPSEDEISQEIEQSSNVVKFTKKEVLDLTRKCTNLERNLGGIRNMNGMPDLVIVLDVNKDDIAVAEACKLGIPIVGIVDSNSNPDNITHPVPGNDDATRAISFYCNLFAETVLNAMQQSFVNAGIDISQMAEGGEGDIINLQKAQQLKQGKAKTEVVAKPKTKLVKATKAKPVDVTDKTVEKAKDKSSEAKKPSTEAKVKKVNAAKTDATSKDAASIVAEGTEAKTAEK
ncbi:MAG: 30S ribosomal protein S2, partial [Pseudomonadota bacterium]